MVALGLDQSQHLEPGKAGSKRWAREDSDRNRGGGGGGGQKKAEPPSRTEDLNRRKTLERVPQPARRERPDESETESDFELQPASDVESPGVVRHEHVEVIVAGRADVTIRRLHDRRFVKLWADEDVRCFDAVVKWKAFNKEASKEKALTVFCPKFRAADAIVSVIYGVEQWDYILRFKKSKHEDAAVLARNEFERRLCKRGVVMEHEQSKEKSSTIYVKLLVPFHVLCVEARTLKLMFRLKEPPYPLPADAHPKKRTGLFSFGHYHLDLNVQHAVLDSKNLSNYQFKLLQKDNTYKFVDCESQPAHVVRTKFFEERHRILIAYNLLDQIEIKLKTNQRFRCEGIHYLIDHRFYTDMYPVHQSDDLDDDVEKMDAKTRLAQAQNHEWTLRTRLINGFVKSRQQPIDLMRDYFGEKIALYFVYLQFYNHWLAGSSVFGVIVFIFGIVVTVVNDDNSATDWHHLFDNALSPYFALLMALWSVLYLRYWQRRNSYFSIKWATHTFEASTIQRHAFEPAGKRLSPITGKIELHYPSYKRHIRQFISFLATLPFVGLVIATVLAQIAFIAWLQNTYHTSEQGTALAASLIGLVSIQICRRCYRPVALRLNEFENYKSEDGFERALVVKNWCFEFLNIYSHIIYFAFVRPFLTGATILGFPRHEADCEKDICSADVTLELIIIFLGDQAVDRMEEILLPWIVNKFRSMRMAFRKVVPDEKHWPQYYKDERRQANEGLDDDYFQKAIQYGYVTMFVTAFPLAPLCAYINNVFEVRLDAYKMLKVLRRPPSFPA
ncbi:calcium-activated chloride channel-domain-containing protein [Zopfochytrium polystomum]|nr:calcium-activated chloride channel-domain-containing protein [Zopfochytrium polystomum]